MSCAQHVRHVAHCQDVKQLRVLLLFACLLATIKTCLIPRQWSLAAQLQVPSWWMLGLLSLVVSKGDHKFAGLKRPQCLSQRERNDR